MGARGVLQNMSKQQALVTQETIKPTTPHITKLHLEKQVLYQNGWQQNLTSTTTLG